MHPIEFCSVCYDTRTTLNIVPSSKCDVNGCFEECGLSFLIFDSALASLVGQPHKPIRSNCCTRSRILLGLLHVQQFLRLQMRVDVYIRVKLRIRFLGAAYTNAYLHIHIGRSRKILKCEDEV